MIIKVISHNRGKPTGRIQLMNSDEDEVSISFLYIVSILFCPLRIVSVNVNDAVRMDFIIIGLR